MEEIPKKPPGMYKTFQITGWTTNLNWWVYRISEPSTVYDYVTDFFQVVVFLHGSSPSIFQVGALVTQSFPALL